MNANSLEAFRPFVFESARRTTTLRPVAEAETLGFDTLIQEAITLLKDSPASAPHLMRRWNDLDWNKCQEQRVSTDAESDRDGSPRITLYPSLLKKPRKLAVYTILREFGHILYNKAGEETQRRWQNKLGLPSEGQLRAVQNKLTPQFASYRELVESFTTAMDRYVALNAANALIANGVPYAQSQNVKLASWGPTQEYFNRRRYHVLIPLVSAYSSKDIFEDFGAAFADWVMGMCGITESSVAEATHDIIREMLEALR
jgi:hypothetical protein